MSNSLKTRYLTKIIILVSCLVVLDKRSDALLLGNLIGCNSFNCRLTALETEVSHLKQQVARMSDQSHMLHTNNQMQPYNNQNQLPNQGLNQLPNQQGNNNPNQQQQQQQNNQGSSTNGPRVNYANMLQDYPANQQQLLRRVADYQNGLGNQYS